MGRKNLVFNGNYDDDDSDDEENVIYKQIGIVVADVVGKGVAASLEMFSVKTVFKLLHEHWFEPQALVTRMNQISTESHLFSKYVPLIYVALTQVEAHQYLLEYVNAGHEPAIVVRATGMVEILDQGGMAYPVHHYTIWITTIVISSAWAALL